MVKLNRVWFFEATNGQISFTYFFRGVGHNCTADKGVEEQALFQILIADLQSTAKNVSQLALYRKKLFLREKNTRRRLRNRAA